MKSFLWAFVLVVSFASAVFADNGGYAVKFNGTDGYASATMNSGNTNSTMTMEFWFSPVATQVATQYLADLRSISGTNNRRVMPYLNNGIIGIFCAPNTGDDNNAITQSSGVTANPNVWYHVAVTINSSTLKMYVNGKLYVTTSLTDAYALTGTEVLSLATDYGNTTYANIKMDEARIWSSERTEAEIKGNMYKELAGSEAGLLSYYKMSNGSGAGLSDNQIAGTYGGVLSGGYTWVASGAFADSRNGLDFDWTDDYVDCGNSASVQRNGTQPFTVEAWVKPTGGAWLAAVSKFVHTSSNEGYSLEIFSDNKVSLLYGNNWSDWNATTSTTALTPGVWSHIAATYDGSTVKIYINGNLSQSAAWANGVTDSGTPLLIGARNGTTFFSGQIDEVRVWTVARTAAQLRESMAKTLVGNEAGLAAYYRLDEIDGNTAYDLSSNANNGTLTNMDAATDRVASDAFTTWIGADSASWADAGNWSKGAVPTATSNVGLYKWALGNEAAISGSPTTGNLLISSTAAPTLSSALTVNGNLVLEKNLDLSGQAVTIGSTSFLVEGSGRAFGASGTIATTRALSNIFAQDVAGLGARITTAADMGSTTITRGHAQQTGGGNFSILRYYDIAPTNNAALNATLVFNYHDAELNSLTENNFRLYRSTDGGVNWTDQGGTLSAANNSVTRTGIASFSRWTIADSSLPLKSTPTITFGAAPTPAYLGGNFTVSASTTNTDSSILTYSYVSGPCAWVSGATFSSTGPGTCVVQADGAATTNFNAASQTQSIIIGKAVPVITFGTAPTPAYLGGNFTVGASTTNTDSSILTYSYVSGPCAWVGGATFSSTGPGTCVVQADGAATTNFNAASQTQSITIAKAGTATTITADTPDPSVVGQAVTISYAVTLNPAGIGTPTGSVTVTDGVNSCTGTVAAGSCSLSLTTAGSRTLTATYAGDTDFDGSSGNAAHAVLSNSVTIAAATGNGNITIETSSPGCGFTAWAVQTEAQAGNDPLFDYPYGLVEFTLNCAAADVTITFPGDIGAATYRKYGPTTPGNAATTAWYTFGTVTLNSSSSITLHLTDGQQGDDTGVDGIIVDQGGPGRGITGLTSVPSLSEWGMIVFALLAGLLSAYHLRRGRTARP